MSGEATAHGRLLYAFDAILRAHYGVTLDVDYPMILGVRDPESGLERHSRIQFSTRFLEVRALRPPPPLDEATRAQILRRADVHELLGEQAPGAERASSSRDLGW